MLNIAYVTTDVWFGDEQVVAITLVAAFDATAPISKSFEMFRQYDSLCARYELRYLNLMSHTLQYLLSIVGGDELNAAALPLNNVARAKDVSVPIWYGWIVWVELVSMISTHFSFSSLSDASLVSIFITLMAGVSFSWTMFGDRSMGFGSAGSVFTITL